MALTPDEQRKATEAPDEWTLLPARLTLEENKQFQRLRKARRIEFDPCVPSFGPVGDGVRFKWRASRQELARRREAAASDLGELLKFEELLDDGFGRTTGRMAYVADLAKFKAAPKDAEWRRVEFDVQKERNVCGFGSIVEHARAAGFVIVQR